jgi:hypothetical protein
MFTLLRIFYRRRFELGLYLYFYYYFSKFGKETLIVGLKIKELVLVPAFNFKLFCHFLHEFLNIGTT